MKASWDGLVQQNQLRLRKTFLGSTDAWRDEEGRFYAAQWWTRSFGFQEYGRRFDGHVGLQQERRMVCGEK